MKAITVRQPWAQLIAIGVKTIETRSWPTKHRGVIAIHAGKADYTSYLQGDDVRCNGIQWDPSWPGPLFLPRGMVVATANLIDCIPMESLDADAPMPDDRSLECGHVLYILPGGDRLLTTDRFVAPTVDIDVSDQIPYGHFEQGRWAWLLDDIKPLDEPVPARGMQGLWNWEAST